MFRSGDAVGGEDAIGYCAGVMKPFWEVASFKTLSLTDIDALAPTMLTCACRRAHGRVDASGAGGSATCCDKKTQPTCVRSTACLCGLDEGMQKLVETRLPLYNKALAEEASFSSLGAKPRGPITFDAYVLFATSDAREIKEHTAAVTKWWMAQCTCKEVTPGAHVAEKKRNGPPAANKADEAPKKKKARADGGARI
jgi:hypothetical protein